MTITAPPVVWIDDDYDRQCAGNGQSRYGAYVADRLALFAECWNGTYEAALPVHFAATAWRVAIGPIMVPGYVRYHRRILHTELNHSYWDGSLLARVDVITSWPHALARHNGWEPDIGRWRDWPMEFGDAYCEPSDEELTRAPYLLTTGSLRFTVPSGQLPDPPVARPGRPPELAEVVAAAQAAVAIAVQELNRMVTPVIWQLDHAEGVH